MMKKHFLSSSVSSFAVHTLAYSSAVFEKKQRLKSSAYIGLLITFLGSSSIAVAMDRSFDEEKYILGLQAFVRSSLHDKTFTENDFKNVAFLNNPSVRDAKKTEFSKKLTATQKSNVKLISDALEESKKQAMSSDVGSDNVILKSIKASIRDACPNHSFKDKDFQNALFMLMNTDRSKCESMAKSWTDEETYGATEILKIIQKLEGKSDASDRCAQMQAPSVILIPRQLTPTQARLQNRLAQKKKPDPSSTKSSPRPIETPPQGPSTPNSLSEKKSVSQTSKDSLKKPLEPQGNKKNDKEKVQPVSEKSKNTSSSLPQKPTPAKRPSNSKEQKTPSRPSGENSAQKLPASQGSSLTSKKAPASVSPKTAPQATKTKSEEKVSLPSQQQKKDKFIPTKSPSPEKGPEVSKEITHKTKPEVPAKVQSSKPQLKKDETKPSSLPRELPSPGTGHSSSQNSKPAPTLETPPRQVKNSQEKPKRGGDQARSSQINEQNSKVETLLEIPITTLPPSAQSLPQTSKVEDTKEETVKEEKSQEIQGSSSSDSKNQTVFQKVKKAVKNIKETVIPSQKEETVSLSPEEERTIETNPSTSHAEIKQRTIFGPTTSVETLEALHYNQANSYPQTGIPSPIFNPWLSQFYSSWAPNYFYRLVQNLSPAVYHKDLEETLKKHSKTQQSNQRSTQQKTLEIGEASSDLVQPTRKRSTSAPSELIPSKGEPKEQK